MPNYNNGKIYSIRCHGKPELIYIGSTTRTLAQRLAAHTREFKGFLNNGKKYCSSFELLKEEDYYIELIRNYPCTNKEELRREEGIEQRKCECVNKLIAGRTNKQYYEDNREKILENAKEYREQNQKAISEKNKKYYEHNREKILEYKKNYHQANKEKITERGNKYREANKEEIAEKRKIKVTCEVCGTTCRKNDMARHRRSAKHQKAIEEKNSN
jgi:hypothetical protein